MKLSIRDERNARFKQKVPNENYSQAQYFQNQISLLIYRFSFKLDVNSLLKVVNYVLGLVLPCFKGRFDFKFD